MKRLLINCLLIVGGVLILGVGALKIIINNIVSWIVAIEYLAR